jgi:hypothetical protein
VRFYHAFDFRDKMELTCEQDKWLFGHILSCLRAHPKAPGVPARLPSVAARSERCSVIRLEGF